MWICNADLASANRRQSATVHGMPSRSKCACFCQTRYFAALGNAELGDDQNPTDQTVRGGLADRRLVDMNGARVVQHWLLG